MPYKEGNKVKIILTHIENNDNISEEFILIKNRYKIIDDCTTIIYLKNRNGDIFESCLDTEDLNKLSAYNYSFYPNWDAAVQNYYARATTYLGKGENGKYKYGAVFIHRIVTGVEDGYYVDHIDHNTLNNKKENLKITDMEVNTKNRLGANKNNKTGHRNVCYVTSKGVYRVQLQVNGKHTFFGDYTDLEEAVECAKNARKLYYPKYSNK